MRKGIKNEVPFLIFIPFNFLNGFYFLKRASTLFAFSELPVARCKSAIDLFSSV
jgi:hypothetical protein